MPDGQRLWRTAEGDLVPDGHPEAQFLAYGVSDDLSPEDASLVRRERGHTPKAEAEPTPKKRASSKPKAEAE